MIFALKGTIEYIGEKYIVIDTGPMSFKVFVTKTVLDSVTENEPQSKIFTSLHVRETVMELYGFCTKEELDFFELLIGVQGVGPRTAMTILSEASMNKIRTAIISDNHDVLMVSGVGKKTAQKIIIDLQNKIDRAGIEEVDAALLRVEEDVVDALLSLGYKRREIERAVRAIPKDAKTTQEKVKHALSALSEHKS